MNEIVSVLPYSEKTARVKIYNPNIARKYRPGHFVIIKFTADGVRVPFSIIDSDSDSGVIDIIIHRADGLDEILKMLIPGEVLPHLLGPLGNPWVIPQKQKVLFFGDGAGVVPLLPLIKAANSAGCEVTAVLSEKSSRTQCLIGEIESECKSVERVTDDSLLQLVIKDLQKSRFDRVVMSGPTLMMKSVAQETMDRNIPADCVLNMLMIDGIGLCGICRVVVGGERKKTCTDGPIFDAHQVDFDQMFNRQRLFV